MFILNLLFIFLALEFSPELTLSVIVTVVLQLIAFIAGYVAMKQDVTNLKVNDKERKTDIVTLETKIETKFNQILVELSKLNDKIVNINTEFKECKAANHNK